ncbi:response regulator [Pseudobacteriovorax antillogorgiicola]|uniref:Response regulator receiver domain-containing protein n=1 Tax=Pseudobacteriovorax antillogorgiicola TaxID=1513793 RepID=A0A1Y6BBX1_9BACT|nr:response regulator [Pseudobacteriovorax antillogorgiicola]TCS58609.1 response regulator receiver domain-containing protein [Pseudobacteriovorax antillogorgiicola]SME96882.1 Response regulator receiver domain-containing protein [Pseudobacteriovorax antillogorgiicola]
MPKILIVDDEVDICEMMSFTFDSHGFETFVAHDAAAAFELVKTEDPDLVVSDIRMPKGGGMKLLEDIKNHNADRPKVFLITGYSDNTREEAISAGAEDVLAKPIKLQELVERVTSAI